MENEYHPVPQPEEIPQRERDDAMGAYLMMFASWAVGLPIPFINLIAAGIYLAINKKSRFVRFHGLQSLYSQVIISIAQAVLIGWIIAGIIDNSKFNNLFIGFLLFVILINLIYVIFSIIALVKAHKGRMYYFVFFGKLAYHSAYKKKEHEKEQPSRPVNAPPRT